ncbi:MAG TPA: serine hydrolase domain-containing protein [Candidatus Binatia bacterium]|nr:serine hydrolase domain-containing protein [Candidatus Binatia bacterium]
MDFSAVDQHLTEAVEQGVFPGAVVLVNHAGTVLYRRASGCRRLEPDRRPLSEETVFDLASLTKPLATTLAVMLLVQEKKLRLDDRVERIFPNFGVHGKTEITFRHLLCHSSGLPAWRPYYREILALEAGGKKVGFVGTRSAKEFVYTQLQREKLEVPPGQRAVYSDLGFMLLGAAVEAVSGLELDQYCWGKIFHPLGLRSTSFINLEIVRRRRLQPIVEKFAPTERCPWRRRVLCAEVHDDNAYAMGGVAGHAGLFSTADDIDRLVNCLIACYRGEGTFLPSAAVREFWTRDGRVAGSTWALGWDTPSPQHSSAGELFSPRSVGHLGFTGTSLWVDLDHQVHVIVLSNRVHPRRDNDKIQAFRPALHDAVMRVVLGKSR